MVFQQKADVIQSVLTVHLLNSVLVLEKFLKNKTAYEDSPL